MEFKTWTIGTSLKDYYGRIVEWFEIDNFLEEISKNKKLIIEKSSKNEKKFNLRFDFCQEFIYNDTADSTINQFLRIAEYLNILFKKSDCEYELTQDFVNIDNKKKLNNFILQELKNKMDILREKMNIESQNFDCNEEEQKERLINSINSIKDIEISNSFFISMGEFFNDNDYKEKIKKEIKKISSEYISAKGNKASCKNYFAPLWKEISKDCDDKWQSIMKDIFCSIVKPIKTICNLPNENIEEIMAIEIKDDDEFEIKFEENKPNSNETKKLVELKDNQISSQELTIYDFLKRFTNVQIPIFQRKYVWDKTLIENLIDSLINYKIENKIPIYLNNIIVTSHMYSDRSTKIDIVDGQQRSFTILLILFCFFKIYCYIFLKDKKKIEIKDKNLYLLYNIFVKKEYLKIYENINQLEETNIYKFINEVIKENLKINVDEENKFFIKTLTIIFNKLPINIKFDEIAQKIGFILDEAYITYTNIDTNSSEIIFRNLNLNSKPLSSLDLFRNYLYSLDRENEKNVKTFNNVFYDQMVNESNKEINESKVANFAYVINKIDYLIESNNRTSLISVGNYELLKKWFDHQLSLENNLVENVLNKKLVNKLYIYKYLENSKKFLKDDKTKSNVNKLSNNEIFLYSTVAEQIYAATQENTVFIPLVWTILKKFNTFNEEKINNIDFNELFKWLFEIERFIFMWKIVAFEGQSLGPTISNIIDNINDNSTIKTADNLKEELKKIVRGLKQSTDSEIDKSFNKELNGHLKNPANLETKTKSLLLSRIHFFLSLGEYKDNRWEINKKISLNLCSEFSIFIDKINKNEYEHCLAQNSVLFAKDEIKKDEYKKYIDMIGNAIKLDDYSNKIASNKRLEDKYEDYKNSSIEKNISFSGKAPYLINIKEWIKDWIGKSEEFKNRRKEIENIKDNKERKEKKDELKEDEEASKLQLDEYIPKILARTKQILKIIFDIYKYNSKSNFKDEEENKEN